MPTNTTNMALPKPIDSDNAEVALASSIPSAFDKLDVHRHTGGADGLLIGTTAIPSAAVIPSPSITGTVVGNATYETVTIHDPGITGTVSGAGTYPNITITGPTITGTVLGSPSIDATLLKVSGLRAVVNDQAADAILITGTGTSSNAGPASVTFSRAFSNAPVIVASPLTAVTGLIGITIVSVSTTGFTFRCYDSNNVQLNGMNIEYIAFGAR